MGETEEYLLIKDGRLKELPYRLLCHSKIKELEIICKNLEAIEDKLIGIPSLEKLSITVGHKCIISPLALEISHLKFLKIKGGNLKSWQPSKSNDALRGSNIEKIYLNSNNLDFFPERLINLKNLEELSLMGNKITSLPSGFELLTKLKRLSLENNKLESFPEDFYKMSQIKYLGLDSNPLSADTKQKLYKHFRITEFT